MTFNTTCYAILSDGTTVPAFTLGTDVSIGFTVRNDTSSFFCSCALVAAALRCVR